MRPNGLGSERGAVAVMVAVMLPLFMILLVFAVDASNAWVHKRHLQGQVDAGAFAGAFGPWFPSCDDTEIETKARTYGGDESSVDPAAGASNKLSVFTSNTGSVTLLINSDKFFNEGGTDYSDGGTPCETLAAGDGHLDLKATESDEPLFFGSIPGFSTVPAINAHARVELRQVTGSAGALPVAVPDPNPVDGAVFFIDEADGSILARAHLDRGAFQTLNGKYLVEWSTSSTDVAIHEQTGVVIAFTGNAGWTWTTGALSTVCAQALVECYEGLDTGPYKGLGFVRNYPSTIGQVTVGDVQVTNSGCTDDSAPYFVLNANCGITFKAEVTFPAGATQTSVSVQNSGLGCSGGQPPGCPLTPPGVSSSYWTSGTLTVPASAGALDLMLNWRYRAVGGGQPISGSLRVGRVYSASDDPTKSGPIEYLRVVEPTTGDDKHSSDPGPFVVKVGIQGSLEYESTVTGNPPTRLRVIGGSQNQSLDCDPDYPNLADELANGCRPRYAINAGSPDCRLLSRKALWNSQEPWKCVAVQTGTAKNQVPKGMNKRVLGDEQPSTCPAPGEFGHNNWNLDGDSVPDYLPGDPRLMFSFVTPFGSFTGSGEDVKTVTNFAMFYVTGWTGQGQGFANPCEGNGDDPVPGPAYIVGHFVKYVGALPGGEGSEPCNVTIPSVIAPCVAVLTD